MVRCAHTLIFADKLPDSSYIALAVEIAAVALSFAGVLLAIKPHILNWPVSMAGTLLYSWVFYECRLYSDMVLQFVFIGIQTLGWWQWALKKTAESPISSLTPWQWMAESLTFLAGWYGWTRIILLWAPDAAMPWLDSFTASISVWAIALQARRKWENWILWLLADIIYIPLYISMGKPLTAGLYAVFLALAVIGLRSWYRQRV
ncbi:MAG: nicotinamide riboside transporter PnuC [Bacteroidetes bacterium]|nr:nicotinamide riboside transporter PnuC [Bacteroidota bacterium]